MDSHSHLKRNPHRRRTGLRRQLPQSHARPHQAARRRGNPPRIHPPSGRGRDPAAAAGRPRAARAPVPLSERPRLHRIPGREDRSGRGPLACAKRELEEETGYTATDWRFVCTIHNAIAYSDEHLDMFLARGLTAGEAKLDEGEFLETFTATVPELLEMVRKRARSPTSRPSSAPSGSRRSPPAPGRPPEMGLGSRWLALLLLAVAAGRRGAHAFQARCEDTGPRTSSASASTSNRTTAATASTTACSFRGAHAMKGERRRQLCAGADPHRIARGDQRRGRMLSDPGQRLRMRAPQARREAVLPPIVVYVGREFAPGSCSVSRDTCARDAPSQGLPRLPAESGKRVREALARASMASPCTRRRGQARARCAGANSTAAGCPSSSTRWRKAKRCRPRSTVPQEYARLSKVCQGEVQSLIGPARRKRTT
jgi:8-oxo-dGTP pyrophosphatase MutT (NUDIX family)